MSEDNEEIKFQSEADDREPEVGMAEGSEVAGPLDPETEPEVGFEDIETPEELLPHAPASPTAGWHGAVVPAEELPPALERIRPERPPLVARWVWISAAVFAGFVLVGTALALVLAQASRVAVPGVVGTDVDVARTRLEQAGLRVTVSEERFSPKPQGEVLDQEPSAGTTVGRGDEVALVVSAGTEEFAMPDVVGNGLPLARSRLEAKGLIIEVESVTSDQESDTVLATIPAPGVLVRIGDTVRVQVSSPRPPASSLQPYRLVGLVVAVDAAPSPREGSDVSLDVSRRLRALLEASGASVVMLRTGSETGTADADRARAASESSATVAVGITVQESGTGGRSVASPSAGPAVTSAIRLRDSLVSGLSSTTPPAVAGTTADTVFGGLSVPWVRVMLGSYSTRADETSFADPRWADEVARSIYSSIGEVFGTKEEL